MSDLIWTPGVSACALMLASGLKPMMVRVAEGTSRTTCGQIRLQNQSIACRFGPKSSRPQKMAEHSIVGVPCGEKKSVSTPFGMTSTCFTPANRCMARCSVGDTTHARSSRPRRRARKGLRSAAARSHTVGSRGERTKLRQMVRDPFVGRIPDASAAAGSGEQRQHVEAEPDHRRRIEFVGNPLHAVNAGPRNAPVGTEPLLPVGERRPAAFDPIVVEREDRYGQLLAGGGIDGSMVANATSWPKARSARNISKHRISCPLARG